MYKLCELQKWRYGYCFKWKLWKNRRGDDSISMQPVFCKCRDGSIKKFAISFQGVDFSISDTVSIIATLTEGNVAEITIGDDCKMAENTTILPNRNTVGSSVLTYNGDYYIAGTATITEDITARNIYLGNNQGGNYAPGNLTIPEGVTITASETVYIPVCTTVVLEGTIVGDIKNPDADAVGVGRICVNGGNVEGATADVDMCYPVEFVCNKKGGSITPASSSSNILTAHDNQTYGYSGRTVSVNIAVNTGYKLVSATWQAGDETPSDMAVNDGVYSFDMPAAPVTINADIVGKQITIGKTVSDPVAKLGASYTEEEPLYSLKDLIIANDAKEGEVVYELAEGNSLPEGLSFKDGIIFGTPTKAYADGKAVQFKNNG